MPAVYYVSGKPIMADYTPATAKSAGDVSVLGSVPCVHHSANPPFGTTTIRDAVAIEGGVYQGTADGALSVGQDAFWDATNAKFSATSAGNTHFGRVVAGPTGDSVGAGPTADGNAVFVFHDPAGRAVTSGKKAEATASATASLTAAQVLGGFVNSVPVAGITLTLPTAALLVAGLTGAKVGDSFDLSIENSSAGANSITLAAGTGGTLRGGTSIAQNKAALIRVVLTNVTAAAEAYTAHSIIGA